ncbi:MAG TPA: SIR2 family protein, partial [Chitinophagaceae bacterium]|nr:SIR2 family protein [Chitinophagaceae bacterium]
LQILISESRTKDEKKETRGFRTVWNPDIQMYPENGVIYHPNGFLPRKLSEKPSDNITFLEDSFGDQLIESAYGHYTALSYHLSQNTCLFIGISLEDATLKHLLRKNAKMHPGHVHYYIYYLEGSKDIAHEHRKAIIDANFEVYNLITLFLTNEEIKFLGQLLSTTDEEIEIISDELGTSVNYRFFLTGSVCVGKSTTLSNFRSLRTHDEWLDQRVPGMEKDPSFIDKDEKIKEIDYWVAQQWRAKNFILSKSKTPGLDIIDRCPLDAFAFTEVDKWKEKAIFTRQIITPEKSSIRLCKGKVILLVGNPQTMHVRAVRLHKEVTSKALAYRQDLLRIIYNKNEDLGIVEIDTKDKSIEQVTKEVSKIIHVDKYVECDLQDRLQLIEAEKISP